MKKFLTSVLAFVCLAGCSEKSKTKSSSVESRWVALARGTVDAPSGLVELVAPRDGLVLVVPVVEGQTVSKGDVLAVQDNELTRLAVEVAKSELAEARAAIAPAEARRESARRQLQRLEKLAQSQLASAQELEQARDAVGELDSQVTQLRAVTETRQARLATAVYENDLRTIRSPIDGVIVRRQIRAGESVNTQIYKPLFSIAPAGPRIVRTEVEEESLAQIRVGQNAEVVVEGREDSPVKATVQRLGLIFGVQKTSGDDPTQRQDRHVVECVVELEKGSSLLLGQRVLVRFLPRSEP